MEGQPLFCSGCRPRQQVRPLVAEAGPAEAPAGIQGCLAVLTVPPHPPRLLLLKPTAVHLGENWWRAEQGLSPRCASASTDPEAPFSWSEEDISHLYGNTTILLAAEGEGASCSSGGGPQGGLLPLSF